MEKIGYQRLLSDINLNHLAIYHHKLAFSKSVIFITSINFKIQALFHDKISKLLTARQINSLNSRFEDNNKLQLQFFRERVPKLRFR